MSVLKKFATALFVTASLLLLFSSNSVASTTAQKRKTHVSSQSLSRAELRQAEARLDELGFGTGRVDGAIDDTTRNAIVAFQKLHEMRVTGRLTRDDFTALISADKPQARESGYKHVEVDLDRQVLMLTDDEGVVIRVLPISSGSNKQYREKKMSGLAYTPRGRFRIYAKIAGWRESPLGLLYYPNYFSGGVAIHGNPSVPHEPESHGCIRIPMSAAVEMSRQLPVGTIVLIYDQRSFVSAKDWAEADKQKQQVKINVQSP